MTNSDYLHPFITDIETINILKDKIKNNIPFTITRFGDGEIYLLNRNASDGLLMRSLKEWGYEYPTQINDFYNDSNKILINALKNSDIIGIMDQNCNIVNISYSEKIWSLKKEFVSSLGINVDRLQICNHMISRSRELGSIEGFKEIIQGKDFHIISTNTEKLKKKNLETLFGVNIGYTHHPFDVNFNNRDKFLDQFKNIKEKIVIMGVGLQKDYGVILRDKYGKISIDMGATMDAWANIYSRPWFNKGNLQEYLII